MIGSWFQIYNSRSSNIRSKAASPSCSSSSLRVTMTKWTWKNSWSIVWCLRHQPWNTRGFFSKLNKAATLHYLQDITPEDLSYPKDAAPYSYQSSLDLWWDMPTSSWSDGGKEALLVLDWQLPSTVHQNPREDETREFREYYFGWTSDKETIGL